MQDDDDDDRSAKFVRKQTRTYLTYHRCTGQDRALFLDLPDEGSKYTIEEDFRGMLCLDNPELLDLKSQFIAKESVVFSIELLKCTGKPYCRNETEISKFAGSHRLDVMFNS